VTSRRPTLGVATVRDPSCAAWLARANAARVRASARRPHAAQPHAADVPVEARKGSRSGALHAAAANFNELPPRSRDLQGVPSGSPSGGSGNGWRSIRIAQWYFRKPPAFLRDCPAVLPETAGVPSGSPSGTSGNRRRSFRIAQRYFRKPLAFLRDCPAVLPETAGVPSGSPSATSGNRWRSLRIAQSATAVRSAGCVLTRLPRLRKNGRLAGDRGRRERRSAVAGRRGVRRRRRRRRRSS
jgi:hypothetical protein